MFAFSSFLISSAYAADAPITPVGSSITDQIMQFMPLFLIMAVVYFLMIRPQQKKMDETMTMLKALKKGDKVITGAGFIGTITKVESDDVLVVKLAEGVEVKATRNSIGGLYKEETK